MDGSWLDGLTSGVKIVLCGNNIIRTEIPKPPDNLQNHKVKISTNISKSSA